MANRGPRSGILSWLVVITLGLVVWLTVDFWRAGTPGAERANVLALPVAVISCLAALWALRQNPPDDAAVKVLAAAERDARGRALDAMLGPGGVEATIRYVANHQLSGRTSQDNSIRGGAHRDLAADYRKLRDRRLVVLGGSGSGKSLVLTRFMIDTLTENTAGPERVVPVILRLTACDLGNEAVLDQTDPETLSDRFIAWTAGHLARTHGLPVPVIRSLLIGGTLVLCLDGLEEMDSDRLDPVAGAMTRGRPRAAALIRALNARPGLAFVATCRSADYAEICAEAGGEMAAYPLAAAHVAVQDLTATEIVDYLRRRAVADGEPDGRHRLIERLSPPFPDAGLVALLGSPWKLYLTAVAAGGTPSGLEAAELDRQLLSSYVPAVVHASPAATARRWGADQVTTWLESVAVNQRQLAVNGAGSEPEIQVASLWRVSSSRWPRRLAEAVMSLPFVLSGIVAVAGHRVLSPEHPGWMLLAGIGLLLFSAVSLVSHTAVFDVEPVSTDLTVTTVFANRRKLVKIVVGSLLYGLAGSFFSRYLGPPVTLPAGLAVALLTAVGLVLTTVGVGEPRGLDRPSRLKWRCLAHAATDGTFMGLSIGLVLSVVLGVSTGLSIWIGLVAGAIRFLETGRYAGGRAWLRYLVAARISGRRGLLPTHLDRFLDWSVTNGLLRIEGGNLRFRHQELQEFLLDRYDSRNPGVRDRLPTTNLESVHDISRADAPAMARLRRLAPVVLSLTGFLASLGVVVTASFAPERLPDLPLFNVLARYPVLGWASVALLVGSVVLQVVAARSGTAEDALLYEPFRFDRMGMPDHRPTMASPEAGTALPLRHHLTDLPARPEPVVARPGPTAWADGLRAGPPEPGVHVLVGPAGVGKTTVAADLARAAHREGWSRVLWVSGTSSWTLLAGLLAVAGELGIAGDHPDAWWTARRVVRRLGAADGRNLLVIDDIQQELADRLPLRQPNLTVVLTAIRYDRPDTTVHRLSPFTRAESVWFLRRRLPEGEAADRDRLAEVLGDNPLALVLLAGAVELGVYDDAGHFLATRDRAAPPGDPEPGVPPQLSSSVRHHVTRFERHLPFGERVVLTTLSALASERVEITLLRAALSRKGRRHGDRALARLNAAGLVRHSDRGSTVSINATLARAVLDRCVTVDRLNAAIAGPAMAFADILAEGKRTSPSSDFWLLPHVAKMWQLTVRLGARSPFALSFAAVERAIGLLVGSGAVRQAAELGTTLVEDCARLASLSATQVQLARESLAATYRRAGDLERLVSVQRQSLRHRAETLDPYDRRIYLAAKDLARTCLWLGRPDEAARLLSFTSSSYQRLMSLDRPLLIIGLNDLAVALALDDDRDRAGKILEVALSDAHRYLGPGSDLTEDVDANLRVVRGWVVPRPASSAAPLPRQDRAPVEDQPEEAVWVSGLPPSMTAGPDGGQGSTDEVSAAIEAANERYPRGVARPLVTLAALLGPGEIPVAVLNSRPFIEHCAGRAGGEPSWQPEDLLDAVRNLQRVGLVHIAGDGSAVEIREHRRAIRQVTADDDLPAAAVAAADAIIAARAQVHVDHVWGLCDAAACLYHETGRVLIEAGVHPVLFQVARDLARAGALRSASAFLSRLLADCLRHLGENHVDTLTVRWHLIDLRPTDPDTIDAYQRLIRAQTRVLGARHAVTLGTRSDLGKRYSEQNDWDAAAGIFARLRVDVEALDGPQSARVFRLRQSVALCRRGQGNHSEAAADLEALLTDQLHLLGPADDSTLETRRLLARCRGDAGDPSGAVAAIDELTNTLRQFRPADDEEIRHCLLGRAHWLSEAARFAEAAETYREVLALLLPAGSVGRPEVADVRIKLARTLRHTGDAEGGIRRLEQLLSEQFARRGPHDVLVRAIWRELGALRGHEYEGAVLRRLLAEQIPGSGEDDEETGAMRARLGAVEREITAAD